MSSRDPSAWDGIAPRYDWVISWFGASYDAVRERLRRDLQGTGPVLEVAAGTGQFTLDIAEVTERLLTTDLSPAMVERLRARVAASPHGASVEVRVMPADAIELPDDSVDAVVAANVLHVMEAPGHAMAEFRRVLRPNGVLLAPTFCHGQTILARATSMALTLVSPFEVHRRFSTESLARFAADHAFDVEAVDNLGGVLPEAYLRARTITEPDHAATLHPGTMVELTIAEDR